MNALAPHYARTADINLFDLADGASTGDTVRVETDDGRTFEGELVEAEVRLARESPILDENGLRLTFERDDGHRMRVSQFSDGVNLQTEWDDPNTNTDGYTSYKNLDDSPGVEGVEVEQADDEGDEGEGLDEPSRHGADEFADEEPRETCTECGGEAVHVDTRTANSWVNEASAYDDHNYECLECGATGSRNEHGDRVGCLAAPEPIDDDPRTLA